MMLLRRSECAADENIIFLHRQDCPLLSLSPSLPFPGLTLSPISPS